MGCEINYKGEEMSKKIKIEIDVQQFTDLCFAVFVAATLLTEQEIKEKMGELFAEVFSQGTDQISKQELGDTLGENLTIMRAKELIKKQKN